MGKAEAYFKDGTDDKSSGIISCKRLQTLQGICVKTLDVSIVPYIIQTILDVNKFTWSIDMEWILRIVPLNVVFHAACFE